MVRILNGNGKVQTDKKSLAVKNLAAAISAEKPAILSKWMRRIKALNGNYARVSYSELLDLCSEFLTAFLENLERGSFLRLRIFIEKISRIRSAQGFRLSEVQRAYYLFYEVITPMLQYLSIKGEINEDIIKDVDNILLELLFELSESYHKRLNEKMDEYIKEIENTNQKLKEISINDELTGCYNFRYFQQVLDLEIARSNRYKRPLSLIIFDIDHFKKINDTFGHVTGNEVLCFVASTLMRSVRSTDMVFRYGGEEFSIILPETDKGRAFVSAERIRKQISAIPAHIGNHNINITISGGVNSLNESGKDNEGLVSEADKALYLAKRQGRNRVLACNI